MHDKTIHKTTPGIMSTSKPTKARIGSDEDMLAHGFHRSSPGELAHYGKFVNREGVFSILIGLAKRRIRSLRNSRTGELVLSRTEGETSLQDRQSQDQPDTLQISGVSVYVLQ